MYPIDLTSYFPELASIPQADLEAARSRMVQWLNPYFPDTDMAPGSVLGDRGISPVSAALAGLEAALSRFASDLIPENVAAGIQYSCPFISKFLGNFGVYDLKSPMSSGIVRLTFSADLQTALALDSSLMFQFETFTFRLAGPITITPAGTYTGIPLRPVTANSWSADVRVTGVDPGTVAAGVSGATSLLVPNLVSAITVTPLTAVVTPASLSSLAKLTQRTALSANASPAGLEGFVLDRFAGALSADAIVPSDPEFANAGGSTTNGWKAPETVLYVRSTSEMSEMSQTFNLTWDAALQVYAGTIPFLYPPDKIVTFAYAPDLALDIADYTTITSDGPAGWVGEIFHASVALVPGVGGANAIVGSVDGEGVMTAAFSVTYLYDSEPKQVDSVLNSRDYKPIGLSILTKRHVTAWIEDMEIHYVRSPGVTMNLEQARTEIANYLNTAHYPENVSESHIVDAMRWAGAAKVNLITAAASVSRTATDLPPYGTCPSVYLDGTDRSLIEENIDLDNFPFTIRSRRYRIDPSVIVFREDG